MSLGSRAAATVLVMCGVLAGCTSDGEAEAKIPDVVGLSQRDAWDALKSAGFDPVAVPVFDEVPVDPPTKRGHVFEQDPAADVTAAAGSDVKIFVHATKGPVLADL